MFAKFLRSIEGSLAHGLGPAWTDAPLRLEPDLFPLNALAGEREALWARVGAADFLSRDEKRLAVGDGAEGVDGEVLLRVRPAPSGKGGWAG